MRGGALNKTLGLALVLLIFLGGTYADYAFTLWGVEQRGVDAEANLYIRAVMREMGPAAALQWAFLSPTFLTLALIVGGGSLGRPLGIGLGLTWGFAHLIAGLSWVVPWW